MTGDSHALDGGTTLSTLVLRALALRLGVPRPALPPRTGGSCGTRST